MGDEWEINIWVPIKGSTTNYMNKQIARGNGGWQEMQAALYEAREYHRPITMIWRGDAVSYIVDEENHEKERDSSTRD